MAMPKGRGEYCYDYDRTKYQHDYYTSNLHRKKYTYVKKGVMKKVTKTQYEILVLMRKGFRLYHYVEKYCYFRNKIYHQVNTKSVECLIRIGHLKIEDSIVTLTEKGNNHRQTTK